MDKGIKLYEDSWSCDNTTSIIKSLETAINLFEKVRQTNPTHPDLTKYSELTQCKLDGEKTFKRALTCRRQGANAFSNKDYEFAYTRYGDAIEDCCAAMDHFEKGVKHEDSRFKQNLALIHQELEIILEGRDVVRPFKEAEEKKRELERPARKKLEAERKRDEWLEEMEREQRRKLIGRGFLGGATVGTLALMSHGGGPSSNDGAGSSYVGLNSHSHGGSSNFESVALIFDGGDGGGE